jgi:tRNA dimethylallyltransferase
MAKPPILVILGPTGTGKSEVARRAALRYSGEVVGFDSIQVYRGLDAATAKPDRAQRDRVPHHCLDIADPAQDFSLGDFVRAAETAIADIRNRGALPILAGGTGLYLQGLLHGILDLPRRQMQFRERLRRKAEARGVEYLHRILERIDPESARRIGSRDEQRILRAVEIWWDTGLPWSVHLARRGSKTERYPTVKIGLTMDREQLYRRLDERVERFFAAGLVDELRRLLDSGCPAGAKSIKAIGYRETLQHLQGDLTVEAAIRWTQKNTRQYAKRQWTWFRKTPGVRWFPVDDGLDVAWERISAFLKDIYSDAAVDPA